MKAFFLGVLASLASADIGTAGPYSPPYLPTRCYGSNANQFPPGNLFVAASDGLWDNGAACGRRYRMRCLSSTKGACKTGTVDVRVVDLARKPGNTIDVSQDVWAQLVNTNSGETRANIEYVQI
ncbi:Putative rlpA-like protein, double-psi beta-barrel [Colletotrichum destructivum]|uniref:RlpA-like protein, double-psi beta-barrel n=1 Tax=Colletotrichum destructivum TaxID=34406 RepID=A0AAX4I8J2_9PEZI|nr:Putative rlpA-like protein, double-psi beta-barrel [Colletotrichum destructivum]